MKRPVPLSTDNQLDSAFAEFSARVQGLAMKVNAARASLGEEMTRGTFDTYGNTLTGQGRAIRDYENALEELKGFIENRSSNQVHNVNLKWEIDGVTHAVRGLEVELVHGDASNEPMITGVVVRGFISIQPADGNESPSYSSRSSSSSIPPASNS